MLKEYLQSNNTISDLLSKFRCINDSSSEYMIDGLKAEIDSSDLDKLSPETYTIIAPARCTNMLIKTKDNIELSLSGKIAAICQKTYGDKEFQDYLEKQLKSEGFEKVVYRNRVVYSKNHLTFVADWL